MLLETSWQGIFQGAKLAGFQWGTLLILLAVVVLGIVVGMIIEIGKRRHIIRHHMPEATRDLFDEQARQIRALIEECNRLAPLAHERGVRIASIGRALEMDVDPEAMTLSPRLRAGRGRG